MARRLARRGRAGGSTRRYRLASEATSERLGAIIVYRSTGEPAQLPSTISIIGGAADVEAQPMHGFDSRGVQRLYRDDRLPLAVDVVDVQVKPTAWDVAWPLLVCLVLPLVLGCGFRVGWPDLTPEWAKWSTRVAILCLLFNASFTLVAYWDLFVQTSGTETYIAAFAGPFIGLGCGYLLVSSLRVKDAGIRHAAEVTTAVRNIAPMLLMMIFPFASDPLVTVSITILNLVGITVVLLFALMWRRAASASGTNEPIQAARPRPVAEGVPGSSRSGHSDPASQTPAPRTRSGADRRTRIGEPHPAMTWRRSQQARTFVPVT